MTLQAAFQALTTEGGHWDDTSETISQAAQAIAGATLTLQELGWGGQVTGFADTYAQVQAHVTGFLQGGVTETAKLGEALRQISVDLQGTDQGVAAAMQANWVPE